MTLGELCVLAAWRFVRRLQLLKVFREVGKRFEVNVGLRTLQLPARRIRAADANGGYICTLARLDIFRAIADVRGLCWRNA